MTSPKGLAISPRYGHALTQVERFIGEYTNTEGLLDFTLYHQTGAAVDTETITIGSDVWRVDELNTSLGTAAGGDAAHATGALDLLITAHGLIAGDGLLVESELMRVTSVTDVNHVHVAAADRALGGTALASHANGVTYNGSAHKGAWAVASPVQIPVFISSTLTNTVFITRFKAFIIERYGKSIVGKSGQGYTAIAPDTSSLMIVMDSRRQFETPAVSTETMTNGAFDHAVMAGSGAPARRRIAVGARVPTAAEVTAGLLVIPHDFENVPSAVIVQVVDSTGKAKAWDGVQLLLAPTVTVAEGVGYIAQERIGTPGYVSLDNSGATDWAATDVVNFLLAE